MGAPPWTYPSSCEQKKTANQLRLVVYPIIYEVLYIPGGAGFLPSTVSSFLGQGVELQTQRKVTVKQKYSTLLGRCTSFI